MDLRPTARLLVQLFLRVYLLIVPLLLALLFLVPATSSSISLTLRLVMLVSHLVQLLLPLQVRPNRRLLASRPLPLLLHLLWSKSKCWARLFT
jgi:hypothetical protein